MRHYYFIFFVVLFFYSCDAQDGIITSPITEDFSEIQDPKERWDAYGLDNYRIHQKRGCECLPPFEWKVVVYDDSVQSISYEEGQSEKRDEQILRVAKTVNDLFDLIERAKDSAHYMEVKFHGKYGYPTLVKIDFVKNIADDEVQYEMSGLEKIVP
jgi:hypothetical protein